MTTGGCCDDGRRLSVSRSWAKFSVMGTANPIYRTGPETERLLHRAMDGDDAEAVFAFNSHPEVMRMTGEPLWESVAQARARLEAYPDFERYGFGRWGCLYKPENKIIGFSGLKYLPELDEVDLGYRLLPEYWNRGLATESAVACIAFGFDVLGLDHIIGLVQPENLTSVRVLEKVGMRRSGEVDYEGEVAHRYVVHRPDPNPDGSQ